MINIITILQKKASFKEIIKKIKQALEDGIDIHAKSPFGFNALHYTTSRGDTELTKFFIRKGVKFDEKDDFGNTPLDCAIINKHTEIVKFIKSVKLLREDKKEKLKRKYND